MRATIVSYATPVVPIPRSIVGKTHPVCGVKHSLFVNHIGSMALKGCPLFHTTLLYTHYKADSVHYLYIMYHH